MPNYKMVIAYDGTRFNGWQKQGNTRNTLQGEFEFILSKIFDEEINVIGSGRTDKGVHALNQIANFHSEKSLDIEQLKKTINKFFGDDVFVKDISIVDKRFHSRLNAKKKIYEYTILNSSEKDVFNRLFYFSCENKLDISKMKDCANKFVGEQDFKSFCANKHYKKSTVRKIYSIDIIESDNYIKIRFCGNGFLYNMVRIMAGTILQCGTGEIKVNEIDEIINAKSRAKAGVTLPPQGLCLIDVEY